MKPCSITNRSSDSYHLVNLLSAGIVEVTNRVVSIALITSLLVVFVERQAIGQCHQQITVPAEPDELGTGVAVIDAFGISYLTVADPVQNRLYIYSWQSTGPIGPGWYPYTAPLMPDGYLSASYNLGPVVEGFGKSISAGRFGLSCCSFYDKFVVAVGAPNTNYNGGADTGHVLLYQFNCAGAGADCCHGVINCGWTSSSVISLVPVSLDDDMAPGDLYGSSVSVGIRGIAVGAPGRDDLGSNSGAVYFFLNLRFEQDSHMVLHGSGAVGSRFGSSVATSGDWLFVSERDSASGGKVYIYRYNAALPNAPWQLFQVMTGGGGPFSLFGAEIALDADMVPPTAMITFQSSLELAPAVREYRFNGTTWGLVGSGSVASGSRLALQNGLLLASHYDPPSVSFPSCASIAYSENRLYAKEGNDWVWQQCAIQSSRGPASVALSGQYALTGPHIVIGSPLETLEYPQTAPCDPIITPMGAVHTYDLDCIVDLNGNGVADYLDMLNGTSQDCNNNCIPDDVDTQTSGSSHDCNGNGIPDECELDCNGNGIYDGDSDYPNCDPDLPANQFCVNAIPIGLGITTPFDSTCVVTDGPPHPSQFDAADPQIHHDVWFRYAATDSGKLTVSTCNLGITFDTRIAVYRDTGCPISAGSLVAAADDVPPVCSPNEALEVHVHAETDYLIRVGGAGGASGPGQVRLTFSPLPECPSCGGTFGTPNWAMTGALTGGSPNGTPWSWKITSLVDGDFLDTGVVIVDGIDPSNPLHDLNSDGVIDNLDVAIAFADSINNYFMSRTCNTELPPPPFHIRATGTTALLVGPILSISSQCRFRLYVNPSSPLDPSVDCFLDTNSAPGTTCAFNPDLEFVPLSGLDCNWNGIDDWLDILDGTSLDDNQNFIPDECEIPNIPGDINYDGVVDVADLDLFVAVLLGYESQHFYVERCDLNDDGQIDSRDIHAFIESFLE